MTPVGRRHRFSLLVLVCISACVAALVIGVSLLRPPTQPVDPVSVPPSATCGQPPPTRPTRVTSAVLLSCPAQFDGRDVVVSGEAIGDLLRGPGDRRWVQVNDDAYAEAGPLTTHFSLLGTNSGIAVLLPPGGAPTLLGGPGVRGDVLRVAGTFRVAATEDQGGPAVIADAVEVTRPGASVGLPSSRRLRTATPVAAVLTAALMAAAWRRRRG